MLALVLSLWLYPVGTTVEHSARNPKIEGLNPITGTARQKKTLCGSILGYVSSGANVINFFTAVSYEFW